MTEAEIAYNSIVDNLCAENGVSSGKMMSSPGICFKGKVFAFFWNEKMTFRLGKNFALEEKFGISEFEFLNPFKNKPPMKGWYVIDEKHVKKWPEIAQEALTQMKSK